MANNSVKFNIGIGYNVDESGLKKLQSNLTNIINLGKNANPGQQMSQDLLKASQNAAILKEALQKAYNADLGATSITKLNTELQKNGTSLEKVRNSFRGIGADGAKAYNLLGSQILSTNVKLKETNKFAERLATTFANTFRYNISASVFNAITGSIKQAVGYVEDLDESLNHIRIVSGQTSDQMAKFAAEANNAAKAMGTTTLDYTDASLIYYQQGLGTDEVIERTNVTMEMANVLGESASQVSDYMTAIWNNFDDGSKSLEYYGDVITKLGASTAASAAEISEGLGKFAAVADTVGLSYEYATAALATVVAETRQSADIVGTAFKTLFARIQDLELGKTLDDGTTLGKYSQALAAVGVNIKDANGQMKQMDQILDEMGSKWNTLSQDQQTALAQNVAGTRQYTQLVALMENWEEVKDNIELAANATGTLQDQQEIYLQSTEAKLKTLKATSQGLYSDIIKPDEINKLIELLTKFISSFDNMFKSFGGGLKSIVGFGAILSSIFSSSLAKGIINIKDRMSEAAANAQLMQEKIQQINAGKFVDNSGAEVDPDSTVAAGYKANYESQLENSQKILSVQSALTQEQAKDLITQQEKIGQLNEEIGKIDKAAELYKAKNYENKEALDVHKQISDLIGSENSKLIEGETDLLDQLEISKENLGILEKQIQVMERRSAVAKTQENSENKRKQILSETLSVLYSQGAINEDTSLVCKTILEADADINTIEIAITNTLKDQVKNEEAVNKARAEGIKILQDQQKANELRGQVNIDQRNFDDSIDKQKQNADLANSFNLVTSSISSLAMMYSSSTAIINSFMEGNLDLGQILMNMSMTLPMLISNTEKFMNSLGVTGTLWQNLAKIKKINAALDTKMLGTLKTLNKLNKLKNLDEEASANILKIVNTDKEKSIKIDEIKSLAEKKGIALTDAEAASLTNAKVAQDAFNVSALANPYILLGAAVLAGAIAAYAIFNASLKKAADSQERLTERSQKFFEAKQKQVEQTKEEAENLNKLADAYDELYNQYKKNEIAEKDMQTRVHDLCEQYGQQEFAIMALAGSYATLESAIKKAKNAANEEAINAANEANAQGKNVLSNSAYKTSLENSSGFKNLSSLDFSNKANNLDMKATASWKGVAAGSLAGATAAGPLGSIAGGIIGAVGEQHIQQRELDKVSKQIADLMGKGVFDEDRHSLDMSKVDTAKLIQNREEIQKILDDNYEELGNQPGFKNIENWFEENADNIKQIADNYDVIMSSSFENVLSDSSLTNQSTLQDLQSVKDKLKETYQDIYGEIEAGDTEAQKKMAEVINKWINSYYSNDEGLGQLLNKDLIIQRLESMGQDVTSDLVEKINGLSNAEAFTVSSNLNLVYKENDIDDVLNKFSNYTQKVLEKQNFEAKVQLYLDDDKGYLTKEEINNLYDTSDGSDFQQVSRINQDEFESYDYESQMIIMIDYYNKEKDLINENKAAQLESMNEQLEAQEELASQKEAGYRRGLDILDDERNIEGLNSAIDNYKGEEDLSEYLGDSQKVAEVYTKAALGVEDLTEKEKALIDTIKENDEHGLHKQYEETGELGATSVKAANETDALRQSVENLEQQEVSYAKSLATVQELRKKANASIDSLQSAYQDLKDIVEDYNNDGYLTVDNLQKLCDMNPQYLSALEEENGQYQLNKEKLLELTKVQLRKLQLDIAMEALADMTALTSTDEKEKQAALNKVTAESITLTKEYTDSLMQQAWAKLNDADMTDREREAATEHLKNVQKQIDAISKTSENLTLDDLDSSKSGDSKDKQEMKDRIDVYHQYERQLKACKNALDELQERQKHLKGKQLLKNIEAQTKALARQVEVQSALNDEYARQASLLQGQLAAKGATFDGSGEISNYQALLQGAQDKYNAAVSKYNKNKSKTNEKAIDTAKSEYDELKNIISEYEKAIDGLQAAQKAMNELMQKQADLYLEKKKTEWEIEFQIDTHKAERDIQDFIAEINKDFRKAANDWMRDLDNALQKGLQSNLDKDIMNTIKKMDEVKKWMDDVKARSNADGEFEFIEGDLFTSASDAAQFLLDLEKDLEDMAKQLKDAYEQAWDAYLEGIDQAIEELNRLNDIIDKNFSKLEKFKKVLQLSMNGESIQNQKDYLEAQAKNRETSAKSLENQNQMLIKQFNESGDQKLKLDANGFIDQTAIDMSKLNADQKKFYEQILQNEDKITDAYIERLELLKEMVNLQVKENTKKVSKAIFGNEDLDWVKQQWSMQKEYDNYFLDDNEKIYGAESIGNKYDTLAKQTKNLALQEKINKAKQAEIKNITEANQMSRDELELAEKRFEVMQAQIALEEAQNNKNTMKLTRDSSGNWSYQYVADEDDAAQKQQELIDKTYEWYEATKQAEVAAKDFAISLVENWSSLTEQIMNDTTLTMEERTARLQAISDYTNATLGALAESSERMVFDVVASQAALLTGVVETGIVGMENLTENQQRIVETTNDATVADLIATRGEMEEQFTGLKEAAVKNAGEMEGVFKTSAGGISLSWQTEIGKATKEVENGTKSNISAMKNYQRQVEESAQKIGLNLDNVKGSYDQVSQNTQAASNAASAYAANAAANLNMVRNYLAQLQAAWDRVRDACNRATDAMGQYISRTEAAISAQNRLAEAAAKAAAAESSSSSRSGSTNTKDKKWFILNSNNQIQWVQSGFTSNTEALEYLRNKLSDKPGDMKNYHIEKFKTGGYTGTWTNSLDESNGRLAMLHQKELVLNESDTANMLTMVSMVRDMQAATGAIDKAITSGIANMVLNLAGLKGTSTSTITNNTSTASNNSNMFNITMNVDGGDVEEIKTAILNLPNLAQQYLAQR